ncbi:MAG: glycosyltransferase family 4 protein [Deltaproteobacteria bacterium]|nr:glycosyltransferase family 4 protein [Deltaproteobacteria bacterium]MCL4873326.1 glycosyltransferase family 4 protein [bacterium]
MDTFLIVITGLVAGAAGPMAIQRIGNGLGLVDRPNERSSHSVPTPRGGGLGIVAAASAAAGLSGDYACGLVLATIGLLGFLEDLLGLPAKLRLIAELGLAFLLAASTLGLPASGAEAALLVFWTVFMAGTANFYNFMDGINGMAGSSGLVAFGLLSAFAYLFSPEHFAVSLLAALACLGFLPFNAPRARVFMGDVGSVFLGFLFASLALKMASSPLAFICIAAFLATFYADAMTTVAARAARGEDIYRAHRGHLYQYLANELGIPHWKVSFGYASVQLLTGALALFIYSMSVGRFLLPVALAAFFAFFVAAYRSIKSAAPRGGALHQTKGGM